jgi:asparagine synthase (glutamine-hydrolysing)
MSGVAGYSSSSKDVLGLMLDQLYHRGPEAEWIYRGKSFALGCRVLPSEVNPAGRTHAQKADTVAVIDGHLYSKNGIRLPEAEMLTDLYSRFGPDFVEQLDGDFAFGLITDSELFLARDHIGTRPLFYGFKGGDVYFASEAKALLGLCTEVEELPPGHVYTQRRGLRSFRSLQCPVPEFDSPKKRLVFSCTCCDSL